MRAIAQRKVPADQSIDTAHWKTFANRAGWTIKYPPDWQVGSCVQCSDPTDPNVFVTFLNPSTKELIMIEHLIDKPHDQSLEQWLNDVKTTTVLDQIVREERFSLNGARALKVINRNSENIYLVHESKTFAIRGADPNKPSYAVYQRMLSTFRFTSR